MTDHSSTFSGASVLMFPDLQSSCSCRLSCSTSAGVRSGQPYIGAFCSWHEIGTARLLAWKNQAGMAPDFDLWPVFICVALSSFLPIIIFMPTLLFWFEYFLYKHSEV